VFRGQKDFFEADASRRYELSLFPVDVCDRDAGSEYLAAWTFFSKANAINQAGNIAGESAETQTDYAHLWLPIGRTLNLGSLGTPQSSTAFGINASNQVVGYSWTGTTFDAFLWSPTIGIKDLNTLIPTNSGWSLEQASGINKSGQIAAVGSNGTCRGCALLLTPTK
jgi:probable HAF family extracellular repeat protein